MTRAFNRDDARRELLRLLEGLELFRSWQTSVLKRTNPTWSDRQIEDYIVTPGSFWLGVFDETKGRRCLDILKEVRTWYFVTSKDLPQIARLSKDSRDDVDRFLTSFKARFGEDFHSVSGSVQKTVDRVVRRGRIATSAEYDILREMDVSGYGDPSVIHDLLAEYEDKQRSG